MEHFLTKTFIEHLLSDCPVSVLSSHVYSNLIVSQLLYKKISEAERLSKLLKVTQVANGRTCIKTQTVWLHRLYFKHYTLLL